MNTEFIEHKMPEGENLKICRAATDGVMKAFEQLPMDDRIFLAICLYVLINAQIDVDSFHVTEDGDVLVKRQVMN